MYAHGSNLSTLYSLPLPDCDKFRSSSDFRSMRSNLVFVLTKENWASSLSSRLCESIWSTCVLRTLRRHLTISLWAYCWGSCSGVWSRWLAHCYRPFSPCTTISRAVNRTCLIYWMCFAFYQGRPNHASLAIRHNTWFLIQLSAHSLFSKSEMHNSGITDYILLLFLLTANILDC